ncbi:YiiX/YebB-like N1pC/P60 family cysteine hydrolase [Serratia fonticola]|uniref:YiiX/YebB-like N1pC/P60 family cysteine hydrolase n=1 Tax=Serratia fonticola TaxID=47917 RepID=UPI0024DEB09C|nr:YiiX/YebB-like N1pC/P60 family cysteine hydrolase [Serratia fonticola]MDK2376211.1 YiiX/YebB-like N1pC/P60 family cysteine hydrolase [Serratia fonticola]
MFILNHGVLTPGDIILTTGKSGVSYAIRAFTFSRFSHAILYVGHGSYIHSNSSGVHSDSINRLILRNKDDAVVLRVRDNSYCLNACNFSRSQIGKEYSVKEAVKTKSPYKMPDASDKQFCSRLVAQSYEDAGLKLVKNSSYCTPQELYTSQHVTCIPCIARVATSEEIDFARSENPLKNQAATTATILKECRLLTSENIQSLEQLDGFVFSNIHFDKKISDIIKESGYLTLWVYEINKNIWRYDIDLFINLPFSNKEKMDLAIREINGSKSRLQRYTPLLNYYQDRYASTKLEYAKILLELYQNLVFHTTRNYNAAIYVFNQLKG